MAGLDVCDFLPTGIKCLFGVALQWMGSEHVNMAKLILMELNDAMAEFEKLECSA